MPTSPTSRHCTIASSVATRILGLSLCFFAGPLAATNIVDGGTFDNPSDIVAWERFDHEDADWDMRDADGSDASGSLRLTSTTPVASSGFLTLSRCFLVTPGLTYRVNAETLIPLGQTNTADSAVLISFNSTSNCNGSSTLSRESTNFVTVTGSWQTLTTGDLVAPESAHSIVIRPASRKHQDGGSVDVLFDNLVLEELTGACEANTTTLCLNDNRFSVQVEWLIPDGTQGDGIAVPMTLDSGLFWFFAPSNLEVLVKVLDACSFAPDYWVYFAATTDVNFRLTVIDTETGGIRQYINPPGVRAQATADTSAFPCS